jgi:hypothetical protein
MLSIPDCLDNRLTDGGQVVSPTHLPHFTPQKHYYFYVSGTQTASVVWWPEFLATDPEARVRFPALPEKKSSGSGTGFTQPREYNGGAT